MRRRQTKWITTPNSIKDQSSVKGYAVYTVRSEKKILLWAPSRELNDLVQWLFFSSVLFCFFLVTRQKFEIFTHLDIQQLLHQWITISFNFYKKFQVSGRLQKLPRAVICQETKRSCRMELWSFLKVGRSKRKYCDSKIIKIPRREFIFRTCEDWAVWHLIPGRISPCSESFLGHIGTVILCGN